MESHLNVKFQCQKCGNALKSKESYYYHKANNCKLNKHSEESGFVIYFGENSDDQVVMVDDTLVEIENYSDSVISVPQEALAGETGHSGEENVVVRRSLRNRKK